MQDSTRVVIVWEEVFSFITASNWRGWFVPLDLTSCLDVFPEKSGGDARQVVLALSKVITGASISVFLAAVVLSFIY